MSEHGEARQDRGALPLSLRPPLPERRDAKAAMLGAPACSVFRVGTTDVTVPYHRADPDSQSPEAARHEAAAVGRLEAHAPSNRLTKKHGPLDQEARRLR